MQKMAELPKDEPLASSAFLIPERKEDYQMLDLSFKEIVFLAIVFIPLALLIAGIVWLFFYTIGSFIKGKFFSNVHLRHRKAH